eukprot:753637-Hanusia_phi.AAC.2
MQSWLQETEMSWCAKWKSTGRSVKFLCFSRWQSYLNERSEDLLSEQLILYTSYTLMISGYGRNVSIWHQLSAKRGRMSFFFSLWSCIASDEEKLQLRTYKDKMQTSCAKQIAELQCMLQSCMVQFHTDIANADDSIEQVLRDERKVKRLMVYTCKRCLDVVSAKRHREDVECFAHGEEDAGRICCCCGTTGGGEEEEDGGDAGEESARDEE